MTNTRTHLKKDVIELIKKNEDLMAAMVKQARIIKGTPAAKDFITLHTIYRYLREENNSVLLHPDMLSLIRKHLKYKGEMTVQVSMSDTTTVM